MPIIRPFRGIRYNLSKVNINTVVAPPYDVISPEQQNELYDRDPRNVVRLILGREEDRYSAAAKTFDEWQKSGALVRDSLPAVYPLVQTFKNAAGDTVRRKGFIALCRLEEFEKGIVLPHEKTLSKAKEDRFKLFKATNSNFSQIFGLYSDPNKVVDAAFAKILHTPPAIKVTFEEVRNQLWTVTDSAVIAAVAEALKSKQVLIADGHHRYETGLAYRDLRRSENPHHNGSELYNYIMMFFTNLDDEGLVIFPTHRVIHSLAAFDWKRLSAELRKNFDLQHMKTQEAMLQALGKEGHHAYGVIVNEPERYWVARLKGPGSLTTLVPSDIPKEVRDLDAVLLHAHVLGGILGISAEAQEKKLNIHYLQKVSACGEEVLSGKAHVAFIMNPTRIEQVRAVAKAGHTMPQKSTFFYPKLLSGLVMNKMAE